MLRAPRPLLTRAARRTLSPPAEIFEHLFVNIEKEIFAEELLVEKEVGLLPK